LRAAGPVLSKAEGVGEPRGGPEELAPAEAGGARHSQLGLGYFCLHNKGCTLRDALSKNSPAGAKPGITEHDMDSIVR